MPVVYLPAPKLPPHGLLAFDGNAELMAKTATPPMPGAMCGTLHFQMRQPSSTQQLHAHHFDQTPSALAVA